MTLYENIINREKINKESDNKIISAYDKIIKEQCNNNKNKEKNKDK